MKNIYIILTQSGTKISKMIKLFTHEQYNHSSIAIDSSLNEFYSFGRREINNPLNGGFIIESANKGVFKKYNHGKTPCIIIKLEIDNIAYKKACYIINNFIKNKEKYDYSIINMILANTPLHLKNNKFFCSEFVGYILYEIGIELPKNYEHIRPYDFTKLKNAEIIYKGILQNYSKEKELCQYST